jgi:hypothetical protein
MVPNLITAWSQLAVVSEVRVVLLTSKKTTKLHRRRRSMKKQAGKQAVEFYAT